MTVSPEHGKRYNTRGEEVVGPVNVPPKAKFWHSSIIADYTHNGRCMGWRANGRILVRDECHLMDLMSEYIEPTAEPAWIEWHGGECPIKSYNTIGEIKRRGYGPQAAHPLEAYRWAWVGDRSDIIAYRITENHEPTETAPIDMSQNRVQWGLLTDAEKAALRVWVKSGGKVKRLNTEAQVWFDAELSKIGMYPNMVYRTVSPPVITEERQDITTDAGHLLTVTVILHDGKPISGTVEV